MANLTMQEALAKARVSQAQAPEMDEGGYSPVVASLQELNGQIVISFPKQIKMEQLKQSVAGIQFKVDLGSAFYVDVRDGEETQAYKIRGGKKTFSLAQRG